MSGIKAEPHHFFKEHFVLMSRRRRTTASLAVALVLLLAQVASHAQTIVDPLPYSRGYLVTGNYVASSVDLTEQSNPPDQNGLSTGIIHMSGVPSDADVVAAYLYWETITLTSDTTQASGVRFRGEEILLNDVAAVKASSQPLVGSTAPCWSSESSLTMIQFRADVLRFLPIRLDKDDKPTGKRLVNDSDLTAHGLPLHTVTLPTRSGNQVPESAGATLVIVYRDPTQPLRKIVLYDGIHIQPSLNATMTQTLRGFYKSSAAKSAKITHIVGSGRPNNSERVFFNDGTDTQVSPPNPISSGSSSQRGWTSLTYDVSALMTQGNNSNGGYGETAMTTVKHVSGGGDDDDDNRSDCLTWGAVIFSTAVADVDHDGLPDGLEDASTGLNDPPTLSNPTGEPLPNLNAMSASSSHKDIFIEFNAMRTLVNKTHGSASAPYPGVLPAVSKIVPPHTHTPTPEVLKMLGDVYTAHGITPHFDVGNIDDYHALGVVSHPDWVDDYTSLDAEAYLVPSNLARGGEVVDERACDPLSPTCQFPDYPGTVSWKVGLQLYRNAPVDDDGEELLTPAELAAWEQGTVHRRRFDRARNGLFHYLLYAHARGKPRSEFPCLDMSTNPPTPSECSGQTPTVNPEFHTPSSSSGSSDLPGGNAIVTLGFWDDFVGRPFVRASTTFHEMGHNLNLWHGGRGAIWGNKALNTATLIEPNCKPIYLSSMSYLFQVLGLFNDDDEIFLDWSGTDHTDISETTNPSDAPLFPQPNPPYRPAWYAPATSVLATSLGVSAAKRFCDGAKFDPNSPPPPSMARVFATLHSDSIDWNGDGATNAGDSGQDVNFDNALSNTLEGFNDWNNIMLDQISAGRNAVKFQDGDFLDFGSGDFLDFGSGDFLDFGSGDFLDFGSGDFLDFGSGAIFDQSSGDFLDFGSGDFLDFGSGDFLDFGSGDFLDFGSGSERQELDFEAAREIAGRGAPYALTACLVGTPGCTAALPLSPLYHRNNVRWKPPTFGHVLQYLVERKRGDENSTSPYAPVGTSPIPSFIDTQELPNGVPFTYRVRAEFDDVTPHELSGWSRPVTITAVNDPPVAGADDYTTPFNTPLNVVAPGVLGNDTDGDSPPGFIGRVAVLATNVPAGAGTLVLNSNGSFTYTPNGFVGTVSFTYRANDGPWSGDATVPLSSDSGPATVTITVQPPTPSSILFLRGAGSATNPSPLVLDNGSPTATTPKQKDSPPVNFSGGNPWADIGIWTVASVASAANPTALDTWIGLKNSSDTNTAFDLRAELYRNNILVAFGESRCIRGVRNGANLAKAVSVPLAPAAALAGIDTLRLRTRIGTNADDTRCSGVDASHSNAAGLRVYFDATTRASGLR